jgi:hypothetical protein
MIPGRKPSEEGATLVFVIITITVFFGMLALAVDIGGVLVLRRQLVTAADSASLAAAQSCALDEGEAAAIAKGQEFASENYAASNSSEITVESDCEPGGGSVKAEIEATQPLGVASMLGWSEEQDVAARARAIWGAAGGSNEVAPMALNSQGLNCVIDAGKEVCGYWHNNSGPEWETSSHWGSMDLENWDVDFDEKCNGNPGPPTLTGWLLDPDAYELANDDYTYVCAVSGFGAEFWLHDFPDFIGEIFDFPINEVEEMNMAPSEAKFAIEGFKRMKVLDVFQIKGSAPEQESCSFQIDLSSGEVVDLDDAAGAQSCYQDADPSEISSPALTKGNTTFKDKGAKKDYEYVAATHQIIWGAAAETGITITFEWIDEGKSEACGDVLIDANAVCVLLEPVKGVGGFNPGEGPSNPDALQAIRLND